MMSRLISMLRQSGITAYRDANDDDDDADNKCANSHGATVAIFRTNYLTLVLSLPSGNILAVKTAATRSSTTCLRGNISNVANRQNQLSR